MRPKNGPEDPFEVPFEPTVVSMYALAAQRHMYEFGTTSEQLAAVKVAAAHHAQYNPNAFLRDVLTVKRTCFRVALHQRPAPPHGLLCRHRRRGSARGGVAGDRPQPRPPLRRRSSVKAEATNTRTTHGKRSTSPTPERSGRGQAPSPRRGVTVADIDYASIYDSFTITVIETIEDLGFCKKGQGGAFVADRNLHSPGGKLPWNTDGGGLCNNHPVATAEG